MNRKRPPKAPVFPRPTRSGLGRRTLVLVLGTALGVLLRVEPLIGAEAPPRPAFLVVVNAKNPVGHVDRQFLADAFLKKVSHWSAGNTIRPADQLPRSAVRRAFSDSVLRRSVDAVRHYWQQRIFSGRDIPPPEFESDAAVLQFVTKHEGAVGYVSAPPSVEGVKVVTVR